MRKLAAAVTIGFAVGWFLPHPADRKIVVVTKRMVVAVPAPTTTTSTTTTLPPAPVTTTTIKPRPRPIPPTTTPPTTTIPPTVISAAESQVGKTGPYAAGGFWCAQFVSWVEDEAHTPGWTDNTSPSQLEGIAQRSGRYTTAPAPGEVAFISLEGNGGSENGIQFWADHTGIVVAVAPDGTVTTVEGNANPDPTHVTVHQRHVGDGFLFGFGRW